MPRWPTVAMNNANPCFTPCISLQTESADQRTGSSPKKVSTLFFTGFYRLIHFFQARLLGNWHGPCITLLPQDHCGLNSKLDSTWPYEIGFFDRRTISDNVILPIEI